MALAALPACQYAAPPEVGPDTRIRLSAPELSSEKLVGELESVFEDTLALRLDSSGATRSVPLAQVERLDVSHGFTPGHPAFAGAGAAIGLGIGIADAMRINSDENCKGGGRSSLCSVNSLAWFEPPIFAALGMLGGWLVSMPFFRTEKWVRLPVDDLTLGPARKGSGVALTFSFRF